MRRTLRPLAALAMLAVVVAGCSNAPAGTTSSNSTASIHEKAVKFAECMRANGVSAFPDPNASGGLTIDGIANGSSVDTSSAAFEQALSACKDLEPPGFTGTKVTPQQRTARLEFAQCVRDNGVPDFPDPTPNGPLGLFKVGHCRFQTRPLGGKTGQYPNPEKNILRTENK